MLDRTGKELMMGDRVAYPVLSYKSAIMRVGFVVDMESVPSHVHPDGRQIYRNKVKIKPDHNVEKDYTRTVEKNPQEIAILN